MIGADGRRSLCRAAAGIALDERRYPQVALTVSLRPQPAAPRRLDRIPYAERPLHRWCRCRASARAWSGCSTRTTPTTSRRWTTRNFPPKSNAPPIPFSARSTVEPGRGLFPLTRRHGAPLRRSRIALVGEAAHVIPPIGAQGLNLGLRDAATIGELAVEAHRHGGDIGGIDAARALRPPAPRRCRQPHARGRPAQPHAALRPAAGARRARPRPLHDRPHRASCGAASCAKASRRAPASRG